jgi:hypothetical protein
MAALRHELALLRREQSKGPGEGQAGDADAGLRALSAHGYGLYAASDEGTGIYCRSFGDGDGLSALSESGTGVAAMSLGQADGIQATSARGNGVHAVGGAALGNGRSPRPAGVFAEGGTGIGLYATGTSGDGVTAASASGCAVNACSTEGTGIRARCESEAGLALEIEGRIRVRGCAVGEAVLGTCTRAVRVPAAAATAESLILLMPLGDPGDGVRIWVSERGEGTFTINASATLTISVTMQYLIVN